MRKVNSTSFLMLVALWIVAAIVQAKPSPWGMSQSAMASSIVTDIDDGSEVYIRYNAGSDEKPEYRYWNAGAEWGTRLVTAVHGVKITLSESGRNYKIHAGIANNGNIEEKNRFVTWESNTYKCDKAGSNFNFESAGGNFYYIKCINNGSYLKPAAKIGSVLEQDANNKFKWEVVTKEQLLEEMETASSSNPIDATFLISDPGFGRNVADTTKANWQICDGNGNISGYLSNLTAVDVNETNVSSSYDGNTNGFRSALKVATVNSYYRVQQVLTGLPNGKYRVSAQGASGLKNSIGKENVACLFVGDTFSDFSTTAAFRTSSALSSNESVYNAFNGTDGTSYSRSLEFDVWNGTLVFGVKNKEIFEVPVYVDNFELVYLGPSTTYYNEPTDFTPDAVKQSPWVEVTSASTDVLNNPQNYFFTIWHDANTLYGLTSGTESRQGKDYKTMGCVSDVNNLENPMDNLSYLWELYKTGQKYVLVNPTSREDMLQTEGVPYYFRFDDNVELNTELAALTLTSYDYNNWTFESQQGYLHRWRSDYPDVIANDSKGYLKVYAIPRSYVVVEQQYDDLYERFMKSPYTMKAEDKTFDISLMLANPEAFGSHGSDPMGWETEEYDYTIDQSNITGINGKACFTIKANTTDEMSQTLRNMPKGVYTLTVKAINGNANAHVFLNNSKVTMSSAGTYSVTAEINTDKGDLTFGLDLVKKANSILRYDSFTLSYSLSADSYPEFYIRKNVGSDNDPEYLYVKAGGKYNTTAVMAKHGMRFSVTDNGALSTLSGFEGLQPYSIFTTLNREDNKGIAAFAKNSENYMACRRYEGKPIIFKPVDLGTKPYSYYLYYVDDNKYISANNVAYENVGFGDTPVEYEIVTKEQLIKELKYASVYDPVDATFFINDPDFSAGSIDKSSWKVIGPTENYDLSEDEISIGTNAKTKIQNWGNQNGNIRNKFMRAVVYSDGSEYAVQQTLTGLPAGWYRLSAQGLGGQPNDKTHNALYLFANNGSEEKSVAFDTYNITAATSAQTIENYFAEENNQKYKKSVDVLVGDDGTLIIGAKCGEKKNAASFFDNFELEYLGTMSAEEVAAIPYNIVPVKFDVNALDNNLVEVKTADDDALVNPQNYFFTIWQNSTTCLALAKGTNGFEGADYNTMSFVSNPDLTQNLNCLWELDKTADGKYVFVSVADREQMIQSEAGTNYFRYNSGTALNVEKASVEFMAEKHNNWLINTPEGYLRQWTKECGDVTVGNAMAYHKIYAIPRRYYVMDVQKNKYYASEITPQDVTLLISNPQGAGTSEAKIGIPAWDVNNNDNVWTKEGTSSDFAYISGKSFFTSKGKVSVSQTISNLLKGKYRLRLLISDPQQTTDAFMFSETSTGTHKEIEFSDVEEEYLELPFEIEKDSANVTIGVENANPNEIKFDDFQLYYYGYADTVYVTPLVAGEKYFIRYNVGTSSEPEYRYLEAGGDSWGTAAVFDKHGFEYTFGDMGTDLFKLDSKIYNAVATITNPGGNANSVNHYVGSNFYNDAAAKAWGFDAREGYPFQYNMYYIESGKNYITYDPSASTAASNMKAGTASDYVEVIPWYQRVKEMSSATRQNPVDATFFIKDPSFSRNNFRKSAWKLGSEEGDTILIVNAYSYEKTVNNVKIVNSAGSTSPLKRNKMVMMASIDNIDVNASYDIRQTITGVPDGHYIISAVGVCTANDALKMSVYNGSISLGHTLFDVNTEITDNKKAYELFETDDSYRRYIEFDVVGGSFTVSFEGAVSDSKSFFDDLELSYYGASIVTEEMPEPKDFTPANMTAPWIEVTSTTSGPLANPEDYLFAIWSDNSHCLTLANGTSGYQGDKYKTMAYTNSDNPINDVAQLWEFYRSGTNGKYIIVNASDRESMMQAEGFNVFRYNPKETQIIENAIVSLRFESTYHNWKFYSDFSSRELSRWNDVVTDVKMNAVGLGDYYKIYAIKRIDYYEKKYDIVYNASVLTDIDVSLLISNPEGLGESGNKKILGWDFKEGTNDEIAISDTLVHKFSALKGNTYFEYRGTEQENIKTYMSQTINNLPKGFYVFSTLTTCAGSGAKIFAQTNDGSMNEELSAADAKTHIVYVPIELKTDGGSLTFGVDLRNYKHKVGEDDEGESNNDVVVKFDHFTLQYMGVTETLASELSDGTYYIRTNLNEGTDKAPEYRYLDAGGNAWGTDPILGKHGMSFYFAKRSDSPKNQVRYSLLSEENQASANHGPYFDGAHYDHGYSYSVFSFEQIDPQNPLKYSIYAHKPSFSSEDKTYKVAASKGYLTPMSNNFDLDVDPNASGNAVVWEIVNTIQRIKELQSATYDNPMDATFFIKDPNFSRNNVYKTSWCYNSDGNVLPVTLGNNVGDNNEQSLDNGATKVSIGKEAAGTSGNRYDYNVRVTGQKINIKSDYNLYQKVAIDNLPAGLYRLSVHGYSNVDGGAVLYAKDENGDLNSLNLCTSVSEYEKAKEHNYAAYLFTGNEDMRPTGFTEDDLTTYYRQDKYCQSIEIKVTSNTLIVGVRGALAPNEYAVFDNFELYYLGEAAQDITDITEPVERYIYNVDAGMYLGNEGTSNGRKGRPILGSTGDKFYIAPVNNSTDNDKFYIYTKNSNNVKLYLIPIKPAEDVVYYTMDSTTPFMWTITPSSKENAHILTIKDPNGRVLQWSGDAERMVYGGYADDVEPRGTRWAMYEPGQYQKDRMFATLGSSVRTEAWNYVRAAKVNMRDLTGDCEIPGLIDAYNKLDAVWTSPMTSASTLSQKANELLNVISSAMMSKKVSVAHPIDVSFFIKNAGLGELTGWQNIGWDPYTSVSARTSNTTKKIASVDAYLYKNEGNKAVLKQTISNIPAGKYKLGVDVRTRINKENKYDGSFDLIIEGFDDNDEAVSSVTGTTISGDGGYLNGYISNFLEVGDNKSLTISIVQKSGALAIDNFRLYYCGNTNGKWKLNDDGTELTFLGDWETDQKEICDAVKELISSKSGTLGAVYAYKDNFILGNDINVTNLGWHSGNNVLFYTDYEKVSGNANVVRKNLENSYSCENLVITDQMPMYVPQQFTASSVSYSRNNKVAMGTLCLPFDLTKKPEKISKVLVPDYIDWEVSPTYGRMVIKDYVGENADVYLPANTPVLYEGDVALIKILETNSLIHKTSELKKPDPEHDDLTLYGNYTKQYVVGQSGVQSDEATNADGLCARDCYYVKSNNRIVRGNHWFNIGPFRALLYRGKNSENNARVSVLYVDYSDITDAIKTLEEQNSAILGYYDVRGVRFDKPQKGLNIVKYVNGTSRKVYVR